MATERQQAITDNIRGVDKVSQHLATVWGLLHEQEEIVAEGRLRLVEAVDRFDPSAGMALSSWVRNYVRWRLHGEWLRKRSRKGETLVDHGWSFEQLENSASDDAPWPDECCALAELCSALGNALWGGVSPSQRRVVVGRYMRGSAPLEIAGAMGIGRGTYDTHRNRAMNRLRAMPSLREHR